jgi:thiazole/oxazole-forming peptide maturase SagD family component
MQKWLIQKNIVEIQLKSVIKRISGSICSREYILVDLPQISGYASLDSKLKVKKWQEMTFIKEPSFIIAKNYCRKISGNKWKQVFSSLDMAIFENKDRTNNSSCIHPELNHEGKKMALEVARIGLEYFLKNRKILPRKEINIDIDQRFMKKCDVGISLYVDGKLRGCRIIENNFLYKGILLGVIHASRDQRFKPIEIGDLGNLTIEITLLSNIKVPIQNKNFLNYTIQPEKGYKLSYLQNTGYYLPETFNAFKFQDFTDLCQKLMKEKAGISDRSLINPNVLIEMFEVCDFFRNYKNENVVDIIASMPRKKYLDSSKILQKAIKSADWLSVLQESDGNIPPIIKPLEGRLIQLSWTRLAFCAWSLAEFGKKIGKGAYIEISRKAFAYLKKHITEEELNILNPDLTAAYLGQLALFFEDRKTAYECAEIISINADPRSPNTLTFQQISSFFSEIAKFDNTYFQSAINFSQRAYGIFEKDLEENNCVQLASHIELANSYLKLYQLTQEQEYFKLSKRTVDWALEYQMEDGSFQIDTKNFYANTRPTGKIIEVLALFINHKNITPFENNRYKKSLKTAIDWMFSMQYNENSTYFIESPIKEKVLGGIRHTYLDSDAWIDSVGHLLLGVSRLINKDGGIDLDYVDPAEIFFPLASPERLLLENTANSGKYPLFFGKTFRFEIFFYSSFSKLLRKLSFDNSDIESILGNQNALIRNYDYLLEYLAEEKIIEKIDIKSLLTYVSFKNAPGFFEANLKSRQNNAFGRGFSKNWRQCLGQALGELSERQFHFVYDKNNLTRASEKELEEKNIAYIKPEVLSVFSEKQLEKYPERKFDENSRFSWEECVNLANDETALIPAHLVYGGYKFKDEELRLREGNTSGLGGWFTPEGAILSGLYEIVQRDAFFYHWLNKVTPERIDPETINNKEFKKNYSESRKCGFTIICLNLTLPETKIPSVSVIIEDDSGNGPLYSLGAGCGPDIEKAFSRSLDEAWSIYYNVRSNCAGTYERIPENYEPFITPIDIKKRLSIWANQEMKGNLDFFISGKIKNLKYLEIDYPKKFKNKKEELDFAVKTLNHGGYETYAHLSKNKIMKKIGFHSARVIVPKLIPMYYSEQNAPINHERIIKKSAINTLLHLFP